jgi:hypothetical protein
MRVAPQSNRGIRGLLVALLSGASIAVQASAQQSAPPAAAPDDHQALAKKLSNPISDLVSVPLPINFHVAKLSSFGVFPASYQVGFGVYAAHPDTGPSWMARGAIVILLPRR